MLTKDVLEAQTTVELPAREMLAFLNIANVYTGQVNASAQFGFLNLAGQSNSSGTLVIQG